VTRARVVTPAGTTIPVPSGPVGVNTVLAPGTAGTLVLAEAAGGWSATLGGKPLAALAAPVDGWAQGFTLPAGGGRLVITRHETARNLSLGVEAAALLVAFVLALPGSRSAVPAPAAEAVPPAEGEEPRPEGPGERPAEGTRERRPAGAREQRAEGAKERRAEEARPARRLGRPQPAMAGVTVGGGSRAGEDDDIGASDPAAAGAADHDPFGPYDDPEYGAARPAEPTLGVAPSLDEEPAPWDGLVPVTRQIPQTPALEDQPGPAADPAPAAPRRGRGQHAARHGKPLRRSKGDS
jgi:hypothetical protein